MKYKTEEIYERYDGNYECPGWECGSLDRLIIILGLEHQNWGKVVCGKCDRFYKWVRDPDKKAKRTIKQIIYDKKFCEICLRIQAELGTANTFTEHHILSPQTHPELDNIRSNRLKLCTQCHQFVETIRKMCKTGVYKNG